MTILEKSHDVQYPEHNLASDSLGTFDTGFDKELFKSILNDSEFSVQKLLLAIKPEVVMQNLTSRNLIKLRRLEITPLQSCPKLRYNYSFELNPEKMVKKSLKDNEANKLKVIKPESKNENITNSPQHNLTWLDPETHKLRKQLLKKIEKDKFTEGDLLESFSDGELVTQLIKTEIITYGETRNRTKSKCKDFVSFDFKIGKENILPESLFAKAYFDYFEKSLADDFNKVSANILSPYSYTFRNQSTEPVNLSGLCKALPVVTDRITKCRIDQLLSLSPGELTPPSSVYYFENMKYGNLIKNEGIQEKLSKQAEKVFYILRDGLAINYLTERKESDKPVFEVGDIVTGIVVNYENKNKITSGLKIKDIDYSGPVPEATVTYLKIETENSKDYYANSENIKYIEKETHIPLDILLELNPFNELFK